MTDSGATPFQRILLRGYSAVNRLGLLERGPVKTAFRLAYFEYKKRLEDPFWALCRRRPELLQEGHVLDVGANIGYTAVVFARGLSGGYQVHAFEPESANVERLRETLSACRVADRVQVVEAAVGAHSGSVPLWHNPGHHADHRVYTEGFEASGVERHGVRDVPLISLDDYTRERGIHDRVAFVKIDVQGYELAVCDGMTGVLERNPRASVALEYMPEAFEALGFDPEGVPRFFADRGYQGQLLDRRGRAIPAGDEAVRAALRDRAYVDILYRRIR